MKKVTSQWLEETNAELERQNIGANDRAELAEKKFRKEFVDESKDTDDFQKQWEHLNIQIDKILSYFLTQTNKEQGYVRAQFVGIYYFLGTFCEIRVPIVMGAPGINAFEHIFMPPELCEPFRSDGESVRDYIGVFADTYDYGYGIEEVERKCPTDFSKELVRSADKHLRAVISLLHQPRASSKAIEEARSSVEIFLKAYLALKEGLTDGDLRMQIGHRLDTAVDRCVANGLNELAPLRDDILRLPDIQTRYEARERTFGELWAAYRLALRTALGVLRPLTGRDCRKGFGVA
jgi:hypothetical protein